MALALRRLDERTGIPPPVGDLNERRAANGDSFFVHWLPAESLIKLPRRVCGQHPEQQRRHAILYEAMHKGAGQLPPDALPLMLGIQVNGIQLARVYGISAALWPSGGKPDNLPVRIFGNIHAGLTARIRQNLVPQLLALGSRETGKEIGRDNTPIGCPPALNMDGRNGRGVMHRGLPDVHAMLLCTASVMGVGRQYKRAGGSMPGFCVPDA